MKTDTTLRTTLVCLSVLALAGCLGTSQPPNFYTFDTRPVETSQSEITLAVGPFELPEYLNRPQIVIRGDDEQLIVRQFDRWGEPLQRATNRRINNEIGRQAKNVFAYEIIQISGLRPDYRVQGRIAKFEATTDNEVVLQVGWALTARGADSFDGIESRYTESIESSADMDEVTRAMGVLLDRLAAEIAAAVDAKVAADQAAITD